MEVLEDGPLGETFESRWLVDGQRRQEHWEIEGWGCGYDRGP